MTALSSDRPSTDPKEDLFGHAPFAHGLSDSICRYRGNDGLVIALYGPWGSGKSTVLGYVLHYLEQKPEAERPVVVTFNPWWFSGQENLARAFLGQLQAVLPEKYAGFQKLRDLLAEFSEGVGGLIDLASMAPGVGSVVGKFLGKVRRKPRDVPALKASIVDVLAKAGKRVLVVIDDIDRLVPEEIRQLFTVIKALADFPNVVYLLAFDREVATNAIEQQSGLPGDRYLEKIIQVPFELPPVDRVALRTALFKRLDAVIAGTPDGLFDQPYWTNVFHDGIDALIQVPRDIVRFANTLTVTYPSVVGEVNPVDFIAVEALRVFLPRVYDVVRTNPDKFVGHRESSNYGGNDEKTRRAFHDAWLELAPEASRASAMALLRRIFPNLESTTYGPDWAREWRRKLRVCCPDMFPIYFRLSLPSDAVRRSEIAALIELGRNPKALGDALIGAAKERRTDGLSKVRALLERLMDHVESEIPAESIPAFVHVLLDVGDELVIASDQVRGQFDFGNESRVRRLVYQLLKRIDPGNRVEVLSAAMEGGHAVGVQLYLLAGFIDEIDEHGKTGEPTLIDEASVDGLRVSWLAMVRAIAEPGQLLSNLQLPRILSAWRMWGSPEEVRAWCDNATASDDGLLAFIPKFCSHAISHSFGDWEVRVQPRLNPKRLEHYVDTTACAHRLARIEEDGRVPEEAGEAVAQYLKEFKMIQDGKDPEAHDAFDD
jgi:predicted KAP-like P-loop ATPase